MLSAHGSAPDVVAAARAKAGAVVNAVCPLVTKVHHEVKVRAGKGYTVVYVGHEGHEEAIGTVAVAPDAVHLVETRLESWRRWRSRRGRWRFWPRPPWLSTSGRRAGGGPGPLGRTCGSPGRSDLCFATTNRQAALKAIAGKARRRRGDRLRQLVQHPGPRAHRPGRRLPPGCCGSTSGRELPDDLAGWSASSPAPRPLRSWCGRCVDRLAPSRRRGGGHGRSTRTSTSRCPASCATPSASWPRPRRWPAWPPVAIPPPAAPPMTAASASVRWPASPADRPVT